MCAASYQRHNKFLAWADRKFSPEAGCLRIAVRRRVGCAVGVARRIGVRAQFGDALVMHLTDVVPNWDPTPNLLQRVPNLMPFRPPAHTGCALPAINSITNVWLGLTASFRPKLAVCGLRAGAGRDAPRCVIENRRLSPISPDSRCETFGITDLYAVAVLS